MDNHSNENNEQNAPNRPAGETPGAGAKEQPEPRNGVLDSLCSAVRKGAEEARDAAAKAMPKVKSAAADTAYWITYGVSFAVVFHWTVAKQLAPEPVRSGFRDGIAAGKETANKWVEKLRPREENAPGSTSSPPPPAEAPQAGTA